MENEMYNTALIEYDIRKIGKESKIEEAG